MGTAFCPTAKSDHLVTTGIYRYRSWLHLEYTALDPRWEVELEKWRKDPSYSIPIWPGNVNQAAAGGKSKNLWFLKLDPKGGD